MELGAVDFGSLVTGDVSSTTMRCDGRPYPQLIAYLGTVIRARDPRVW